MAANDLSAGEISSSTPPNTPRSSGGVSTANPALQVWRPERKSRSLLRSFGSCFRPDDASSQPVDVGQLAVVSPARPSHSRSPSRGSTRISTPHVASPSVVTTGAPKHQDLVWQKALNSLTEEDRVALNFQSAEKLTLIKELTEIIEQKREIYLQKRWKFNYKDRDIVLRDVADKLLSWIDKFKQIGDTIVQYDPVHAALPWAGFRFLLQAIGGESEAMASILVASETIAKILDRCAIYERLYLVPGSQAPETRMMENSLIELYASILRFLAQAKRFYEKNTAARITTSIFDVNGIKPLLDAIETSELEVCKIAGQAEACYQRSTDQKFIDQVTKLKNALDHLAEPIIRIDHTVEALHKALEEKRKDEILKWLSSVPYKQHHNTARKGRLEDSGQWFLTKDDFKNWQESSSSTLLWLHGIPGAGKTKLTSLVIDITADRLKSQNSGEGFAYFYCKRDEEERRNPDSIFGAILKQLVLKPNFYSMHKFVTSEYETNKADGFASGKLALEGSKQLIIQLLNIYPQTTIIIDALDECSPEKRETVLDALQELIHLPNNLVKIFLSSRKDNDIYQLFKRVPNISIEATDNANDIQRFIHESIDDSIARKKLLGGKVDKELQDQICTKLLEGAKGMFLWVDLQIHMLCGLKLDSEVKKKLGTLPDGLDKTYDAIFSEMIDCESADSKRLAYVSMMWIMCSRRQLSPDELVRAAVESLVVSNGPPEPRFVNIDTILALCHNLVVVDVQLNVMRFSHLSVREFLEEYMWDTTVVNSMAAEVCMSLLIRGLSIPLQGKFNPRSSFPYLQITGGFTLYPAYYWHYHLQDCGTGSQSLRIQSLVKRFLGTFETPGLGFMNWLNISDYFSIDIGIRPTTMKLACFKYNPPNILPVVCYFGFGEILGDYWSSDRPLYRGAGLCSDWELLELALTEGHEYIINALLRRVVIAKRDFFRVLDIAITAGRGRALEQLLHSAIFTSPTDSQLLILFRKAVIKRNNDIVKVVVSFMKAKTKGYKKLSTLGSDIAALIAWGGSLEMLSLLFDELGNTNLDLKSRNFGRTALQVAVDRRHPGIIKYLLSRGANMQSLKHSQINDLQWAEEEQWFHDLKCFLENNAMHTTYTQSDILRTRFILMRTGIPLRLANVILDLGEFWVRSECSRRQTLTVSGKTLVPYVQLVTKSPLNSPIRKIVLRVTSYGEAQKVVSSSRFYSYPREPRTWLEAATLENSDVDAVPLSRIDIQQNFPGLSEPRKHIIVWDVRDKTKAAAWLKTLSPGQVFAVMPRAEFDSAPNIIEQMDIELYCAWV